MDPRAQNGWAEHVFRTEHLFLEYIYTEKQMQQMGIDKFDFFAQKLNTILDQLDYFRVSVEVENRSSNNSDIYEVIEKIKKIKTSKEDDGKATKEKTIAFLYGHAICFKPTDKVKGEFPISIKFLSNMIGIVRNQKDIHHSHVTGKINGYAFCVQSHNQFRFDFFLFLKGLRPSVWETIEIAIG